MSHITRRCVICRKERFLRDFDLYKGRRTPTCELCRGPKALRILYQEKGLSLRDVGRVLGVSCQTVLKRLRKFGIAPRGRSEARIFALQQGKFEGKSTAELNESLFSEWSQPMAYLLGYIFTDGSLVSRVKGNGHMVQITSIDRDHLEKKLAPILGKNLRIYPVKQAESTPVGGEDRYMIQFTRSRMVEDLCKLGLTERKSLTMKFPEVPEEYLRDFVRGCWDGDGSIFMQRNGTLVAQYVTGSLSFIEGMRDRLRGRGFGSLNIAERKPERVKGNIVAKNSSYYFKSSCNKAARLCEFLYDNVPADLMLERKVQVYEDWKARPPRPRKPRKPRDIRRVLGHRGIQTTEGYVHYEAEQLHPVLALLESTKLTEEMIGLASDPAKPL